MNRTVSVFFLSLGVLLFLAEPAFAQRQPGRMAPSDTMQGPGMGMMYPGMMQGGMMGQGMMQMMRGMHQQMMQNPMHRSAMMAFMLPALADTLGLSDEQVEELTKFRSEMMTQHQEQQQQMMAQRQELQGLFEGEDLPSPDALRNHLMGMAERQVDQRVSAYDTAQRMRSVLTPEQREMLDGMTQRQQMHQMMSHMPMMDMMRMMRSMQGGMMGPGMMLRQQPMRGPMMQQGNMPGQQRRNQ